LRCICSLFFSLLAVRFDFPESSFESHRGDEITNWTPEIIDFPAAFPPGFSLLIFTPVFDLQAPHFKQRNSSRRQKFLEIVVSSFLLLYISPLPLIISFAPPALPIVAPSSFLRGSAPQSGLFWNELSLFSAPQFFFKVFFPLPQSSPYFFLPLKTGLIETAPL